MMELLCKRLANLLTVKSLVTLALTITFCVLTVNGRVEESFMTIFTVVVSFYFGIQSVRTGGANE